MSSSPRSPSAYKLPTRALTSRQERKLVDYLDERFLDLTRNFKKRSEASSTLQTLPAYLTASRALLAFILQIPPIDPSTSLRVAYLLHLTGDALNSITGYKLSIATGSKDDDSDAEVQSTLQDLAAFLDDLDEAWVAVLRMQVWDPTTGEGVDLSLSRKSPSSSSAERVNGAGDPISEMDLDPPTLPVRQSPPTQTDLARLKSLLYSGESRLEEWIVSQRGGHAGGSDGNANGVGGESRDGDKIDGAIDKEDGEDEEDISSMLDRMGVRDDFDSLFARTLNLLGGFGQDTVEGIVNPGVESMME